MPTTPPLRPKSHFNFVHCAKQMKPTEEDERQRRYRKVERYKRLLRNTSDPQRQEHLRKLIKAAEVTKGAAGDSKYQLLGQASRKIRETSVFGLAQQH